VDRVTSLSGVKFFATCKKVLLGVRDASCFNRGNHSDASVTQIVSARAAKLLLTDPRLPGETDQARELASAGPRCCAGLRRPADAGLIGCARLRCPAGLIRSADAERIGCAGPRCPAGLILPADAGRIGCAGLRCPAGLILPAHTGRIWRLSERRARPA